MEPLFYTLSDFSKKTDKSIDELLIMGRNGQIALCVELDSFNGMGKAGTITIDDDFFNSLPDQPEDNVPDYVLDAVFPNLEAVVQKDKVLPENLKVEPIHEPLDRPKLKRLELPTPSVTKISGKWYHRNLKTGEKEREDIPPKGHNPEGYGCFLSGLYQIPAFSINRKAKTYATGFVFPCGHMEMQIQIAFHYLSGSIDDLLVPAGELKKLSKESLEERLANAEQLIAALEKDIERKDKQIERLKEYENGRDFSDEAMLVGSMLNALKKRYRNFTQESLIEQMVSDNEGVSGLSTKNIQVKFAKAKKVREDFYKNLKQKQESTESVAEKNAEMRNFLRRKI